jgi:hypothetical protein
MAFLAWWLFCGFFVAFGFFVAWSGFFWRVLKACYFILPQVYDIETVKNRDQNGEGSCTLDQNPTKHHLQLPK